MIPEFGWGRKAIQSLQSPSPPPRGEATYIFVDPIFNMSANDDAGSKQIDAIFKAVKVRRSPRLHAGSEGSKNETKRRKKMMQLATTPFPSPPKPLLLQVAV